MFLKAATNNKSETALLAFLEGVAAYGLPSRLRTDRGGENVLIGQYMIKELTEIVLLWAAEGARVRTEYSSALLQKLSALRCPHYCGESLLGLNTFNIGNRLRALQVPVTAQMNFLISVATTL